MRRRNTDIGPQGQVQYMEAVSAGQNIGGNRDYVDIDNFYPADGMPENDSEFADLTNRRSQIDKVDMVYDNDINDLGNGADFFDGDYQNSYADGDEDDEDDYDEGDYYNADDDDDDDDDERSSMSKGGSTINNKRNELRHTKRQNKQHRRHTKKQKKRHSRHTKKMW